ncbi:MAG: DUF4365 domain-containing protein [Anaerolineales bacterium]|nr:DUF4365 domain-containing protein [Anaerolineales bacterium]
MPSITNEQLKGNFAENLVAEWISRVCLVRPVAVGTDIGIDLYCESLLENDPYLHFWVQVKAIGEKDIITKDGIEVASYRFTRNHLEYWSRQPIPVYAFLVPVIGWPPKYPERIYGIPVTRYIVENGLPTTETIRLETSECTKFATIDKDWNQFVTKIVPVDSSILLISKGLVSNIDFRKSEYQHFPRDFALRYYEKILNNVRDAVIIVGSETLKRQSDDHKGVRQFCETLASLFIPYGMHELGIDFLIESALKDRGFARAFEYLDSIQRQVVIREDIDDSKKAELISKLELIQQRVTNLMNESKAV